MKKIVITRGSYGHFENGIAILKTADSEPFFVADAEAKRLIALNVAELAADQKVDNEQNLDDINVPDDAEQITKKEALSLLSNKVLMAELDKAGIEYDKRGKKEYFVNLLLQNEDSCSDENDENPDFSDESGVA